MRPKIIALIAVSALALVGCASGDPSVAPANVETASPSVFIPSTPEPIVEVQPTMEPIEHVEEQFADFAETRASVHGAKKPSRSKVIDGFHDFCESGDPFKISETVALNENLEFIANKNACDELEVASSDLP